MTTVGATPAVEFPKVAGPAQSRSLRATPTTLASGSGDIADIAGATPRAEPRFPGSAPGSAVADGPAGWSGPAGAPRAVADAPVGEAGEVVLLAVDVGLRIGLAEYTVDGLLRRCASRHAANRTVLRRLAADTLHGLPGLRCLALEGGGPLAEIWAGLAARRGVEVLRTSAEEWRRELLLGREQRNGRQAKAHALRLAEQVRREHGVKRADALRDDAAEAILLGLWACRRRGWSAALPELRHAP